MKRMVERMAQKYPTAPPVESDAPVPDLLLRAEELARTIALEAGKPIKQARIEVGRSVTTFSTAAEEATRFHDEVLHLDDGVVADRGPHAALLRRSPSYAALVNAYEDDRAEPAAQGVGAP